MQFCGLKDNPRLCRGLTSRELALLCALLVCDPMSSSALYSATLQAICEKSSSVQLADLAWQVTELTALAPPAQWASLTLQPAE